MINSDFADIELQKIWIKELSEIQGEPFFFYDTKGQCYMHELPEECWEAFDTKDIETLRTSYHRLHKEVLRLRMALQAFFADVVSFQDDVFFNQYSRQFRIWENGKYKYFDNYYQAIDAYITMRLDELTIKKAIEELEENCK